MRARVLAARHEASLVSYGPLARGFLKREPWKPQPGDGISSNWLIAELTHHLPDRSDPHLGGRLARLPRTVNGTGHTGPMTCAIRPPSLTVTFNSLQMASILSLSVAMPLTRTSRWPIRLPLVVGV